MCGLWLHLGGVLTYSSACETLICHPNPVATSLAALLNLYSGQFLMFYLV